MTSLLMTGRADCPIDASIDLHFADYLRSDDYQRVLATPRTESSEYLIEA